ncbi:MAG: hypothetical protein QOG46_944 [Pseudonocardiales bacterium]|nr:hypothetical protein [Pseudonocardiales bacterium]
MTSSAPTRWSPGPRRQLIEELTEQDPAAVLPNLPALLGTVLALVDAYRQPPPSGLDVLSGEPPTLRRLERLSRDSAIDGAMSRVLDAIGAVAAVDPATVCAAIADLIADERDTERGTDVVWWLLRTLGRIGQRHGSEPRVLRTILPALHSYLVDTDISLRARTIDPWVEIAASHQLPSSLLDLLPALTSDTHIAVARALARATGRLTWPEETGPGGRRIRVIRPSPLCPARGSAAPAPGAGSGAGCGSPSSGASLSARMSLGGAWRAPAAC